MVTIEKLTMNLSKLTKMPYVNHVRQFFVSKNFFDLIYPKRYFQDFFGIFQNLTYFKIFQNFQDLVIKYLFIWIRLSELDTND